jgi:hypothetical protein
VSQNPVNPLAGYLSTALSNSGDAGSTLRMLVRRVERLRRLRARWALIVPLPFRAHVHPANFEGGQLLLEADSPAWATRAHHQKPTLIERLSGYEEFAGIAGIRIRVSPVETARPSRGTQTPRIPPAAAGLLNATAETVSDPKLKAALHRLAATAKRNDRH